MDLLVSSALADLDITKKEQEIIKVELENESSFIYQNAIKKNVDSFIALSAVPHNHSEIGISPEAYCQHNFYILNSHKLFGKVLNSLNLQLEEKDLITDNFTILQSLLMTFIQECVSDYYFYRFGVGLESKAYTSFSIVCNPTGSLFNIVDTIYVYSILDRLAESILMNNSEELFHGFDILISRYSGAPLVHTPPKYVSTSTPKEKIMTIFDICYSNANIKDFSSIVDVVQEEQELVDYLLAIFDKYSTNID